MSFIYSGHKPSYEVIINMLIFLTIIDFTTVQTINFRFYRA